MTHEEEVVDFYTRESQMVNGFIEMMRGFWNNQDLKIPDLAYEGTQDRDEMTVEEQK